MSDKKKCHDYGSYKFNGGNSGKGGKGGNFGLSGKSIFLKLSENIQVEKLSSLCNCNGKNGEHGQPGNGGKTNIFRKFGKFLFEMCYVSLTDPYSYGYPGLISHDLNSNELKSAQPQTQLDIYSIENDYIYFLNDDLIESELKQQDFIKKLIAETFSNFNLFDLKRRINILMGDDEKNLDLLDHLYNETRAKLINKDLIYEEQLTVGYLSVWIKSAISRRNRIKEPLFVLDVAKYIDSILKSIDDWNRLIINTEPSIYLSNLNEKIKEANGLIAKLELEIDQILENLNESLLGLAKEIAKQREGIIQNKNILQAQKKELNKKIVMKNIFATLKILAGCLAFFGPEAALAGVIIHTGLDLGAQFTDSQMKFKNLNAHSNIDESVRNFKAHLDTRKKLNDKQKNAVKSIADIVPTGSRMLGSVADLVSEKRIDDRELFAIDEQIKETENQFDLLYVVEDGIKDFQENLLKEGMMIFDDIKSSFDSNSIQKSLPVLSFKQYEVKNKIDDMKRTIFKFIETFDGKSEIEMGFNRVEFAVITLFEILKNVDAFRQQAELAGFIASLAQAEGRTENRISEKYKQDINAYKKKIIWNIITERYMQATLAYRYWSFPFSCNLKHESKEFKSNEVDEMIMYKKSLEDIKKSIESDRAQINYKTDNRLHNFMFVNESAFYKWSSKEYPLEIGRLMSGKRISLYSDIKSSAYEAVKFCTIFVNIEIKESGVNAKLQNLLKNFYIELEHPGISKYKINNKFYIINSNNQFKEKLKLKYQYGCDSGDKCLNMNESYKKLAKSKPMLSPFTFWEMKFDLIDKNANEYVYFSQINKLIQSKEIIISLNGYGQYVDLDLNDNSLDMSCLNDILD